MRRKLRKKKEKERERERKRISDFGKRIEGHKDILHYTKPFTCKPLGSQPNKTFGLH